MTFGPDRECPKDSETQCLVIMKLRNGNGKNRKNGKDRIGSTFPRSQATVVGGVPSVLKSQKLKSHLSKMVLRYSQVFYV